MKKTIIILLIVFASMFMFVGCQKIELSEADEKLFIAYAVDSVLKYDYDYPDKLVKVPGTSVSGENSFDDNKNEEQTTETEDEREDNNNSSSDNDSTVNNEVSMTDIMNVAGFSFDVTGFQVSDKYLSGKEEVMTASDGKNLLIIDISVRNRNDSENNLNIIGSSVDFSAIVNNTKKFKPQIWVWEDGCTFNVFEGDFEPGETKKMVLAFQVEEKLDVNNIKLLISNGKNEGYVIVK